MCQCLRHWRGGLQAWRFERIEGTEERHGTDPNWYPLLRLSLSLEG